MARIRMVTRTVDTTTCTAVAVNLKSMALENLTVTVSGRFSENADMLKHLQATKDTDTFKFVQVLTLEHKEVLYGMPEDEFLKHAKVLPPRTNQTAAE